MRKTRLLLGFPLLVTTISVIDHLAQLVTATITSQKLVSDLLSASIILGLSFWSPYVLRWLAVKEAPPLRDEAFKAEIARVCQDVSGASPRLVLLASDKATASCSGSGKTSTIFLTTGLLSTFSRQTVLATIAHECGHLRMRHAVHQALMFSCMFLASRWMALPPFSMPVFMLVYLAVARQFELTADQQAADHVGTGAMTQCLIDLSAHVGTPAEPSKGPRMSMWRDLLCSHPSFERRIAALQRHAIEQPAR
jgi:Zn-dependent protease with chaperone function